METPHQIVDLVYSAKANPLDADNLIRSYTPFIKKEASKSSKKICTEQDDEFSIAMIAFHEAILGYSKDRGAFLNYASMVINSRIIDFQKKELRYKNNISLQQETYEDTSLIDTIADDRNYFEESDNLKATQEEIKELASILAEFDVTFADIADNSPKQARTLDACSKAIRFAAKDPQLLEELLSSKKIPMAKLVEGAKVERKTLERHRKYILAMLLIQTNGYEIIRGHITRVLK